MFQLLKQPSFDFMSRGKLLLTVSLVLCLVCGVLLAVRGLNQGIEFAGGTELQLKFQQAPDLAEIRSTLAGAGVGSAVVTTIGSPEQNEVYIKIAAREGEDAGDLTEQVTFALRGDTIQEGLEDLNVIDTDALERLLAAGPGVTPEVAAGLAEAVAELRKEIALLASVDDLAGVSGMTPELLDYLRERTYAGGVVLRSQSYIGPAIGWELKRNALGAIMGSLLGMLVYIWIRFQLQWGFAAVIALAHDTLIVLGLFSLFGKEMSLPVVAAFLTLVGYSVNDTVVVFDRIRENLRLRVAKDFRSTVNLSINQTLSRTIITSGLTFVVVFGLFLFGGAALSAFSFVLSAGVVVGTYSSIYIASPLLVLWTEHRGRDVQDQITATASAEPRRARKVRGRAAK